MNTIELFFPNYEPIGLEQINTISLELYGYLYTSQKYENDSVINYYPQKSIPWYYNSFMPIITVEEISNSSGFGLRFVGKLKRTVRLILSVLYVAIGIMQCFLIKFYLEGSLENGFIVIIPLIVVTFLFIMSALTMRLTVKEFADKYRIHIEQLISKPQDGE